MTEKKLSNSFDSDAHQQASPQAFCPACGADLTPIPNSGDRACRSCGLVALGRPEPASLAGAAQTVPAEAIPDQAGAAIIGLLEQSADPSGPLLAARAALGPAGVLYLEIGTGGLWAFPKKSLMLLMERCGFRLIRKLDRDGRRGLYRRY